MNKVLLIKELLKLPNESEYFDFKREWHHQNVDLIHDILCLSNSDSNHDRYLIIGIEDKSNKIIGVSNEDPNRRNQENLLGLLRTAYFNHLPNITVETIILDKKEIDIIEVKNSLNKPFFLTKDYSKGDSKLIVRAGVVYTRYGCTNTPKTGTALDIQIEKMYKERFGFELSIIDRFKNLLNKPEEWEGNLETNKMIYHKNFPEFKVKIQKYEKIEGEGFSCFFDDWEDCYKGALKFYYHATEIYITEYFWGNQFKVFFPYPKISSPHWDEIYGCYYFYFDLESFEGKLFNMIYPSLCVEYSCNQKLPILVFNSSKELEKFNCFLTENKKECLKKEAWDFLEGKSLPCEKKIMSNKYLRITENAKYSSKIYQLYIDWINKKMDDKVKISIKGNIYEEFDIVN